MNFVEERTEITFNDLGNLQHNLINDLIILNKIEELLTQVFTTTPLHT